MRARTLEERRDDRGYAWRGVSLSEDGSLAIEGQDLGKMPEGFWGEYEYEFSRTLSPAETATLRVPFYFAARSPMLYKIHRGGVPSYQDGCDDLIYLVSTVERLQSEGCPLVFTDRNAATSIAEFTDEENRLDELIDWPLMNARIWRDVPAQPDRKERRMAECLAYRQVPWSAFVGVATRTEGCADAARATLATLGGVCDTDVGSRD